MEVSWYIWAGFSAFILLLLIIDLKVVMRKPDKITTREAAFYSAVWVSLGIAFTGVIAWWYGPGASSEYITGYLIEKSLSMDNVFLWSVLFTYFKVPPQYQHKVLFWGIFGALVMRLTFILGGIALLNSLEWIIYIFGGLLLFTAYKLFKSNKMSQSPENNPILKWVNRHLPQSKTYSKDKFFITENGRRLATPLLTVLVIIELSDLLFAIDSVPAILSITRKEFIVFSSNAFAVLGLRALYFLLANIKDRFVYLDKGLAIILAFVGIKFLISEWLKIPVWFSLSFIAVTLTATILISLKKTTKKKQAAKA